MLVRPHEGSYDTIAVLGSRLKHIGRAQGRTGLLFDMGAIPYLQGDVALRRFSLAPRHALDAALHLAECALRLRQFEEGCRITACHARDGMIR